MPVTLIVPEFDISAVDEGLVPASGSVQALPTTRLAELVLLMLTALNTALLHASVEVPVLLNVKVPPFALNVPDVIVSDPLIDNVPEVEVNIPVLKLKLPPVIVIAAAEPVNVPSDCV